MHTGRITICELGMELPVDPFLARAETASRAIEDAVSNPVTMIIESARRWIICHWCSLTKPKENAYRIHLFYTLETKKPKVSRG